jgi:hypothetical protein
MDMDSAVIHITEIDCEVGGWWNCLRVMCIWRVAVLAMLNLHISLASGWEIWGSDSGMAKIEVFWDVTLLLGEQFPEFQRNVVPANNRVSFT